MRTKSLGLIVDDNLRVREALENRVAELDHESHSVESQSDAGESLDLSLPQMWDEFSGLLTSVCGISMPSVHMAMSPMLPLPDAMPGDRPSRKERLNALAVNFSTRLDGGRRELGSNAYACLQHPHRHCPRPPGSPYFQKDRDTIEKRSVFWMNDLSHQSQATEFDPE